jgi:cytidylate kinase
MRIDLVQYLKDRYLERNLDSKDPGPVVTIARETGCPGKKVAQRLNDVLNHKLQQSAKKAEWKWIGKEIFTEAARELNLGTEEVEQIFKQTSRSLIDQILSAQSSKFYKNDKSIRKTIGQTIRSMANDGNVIILGRGGVALTRDIKRSLHIYLEAPLEWRASVISEKQCCKIEEAKKIATEIDKRRAEYRDYFQGKGNDYTWFDVRYNCMTLSIDEIAESIVKLMEVRKLI